MEIRNQGIDNGQAFDWGRASKEYAKYRDIYPKEFYAKLAELSLGIQGQKVLDIGTGTGVLPRNMYAYGADWTGADISENQIAYAKRRYGVKVYLNRPICWPMICQLLLPEIAGMAE